LIVPNPESALNEEAGRLLLEEYDTYAKHAHLMTTIHAMKNKIDFSVGEKSDNREALTPVSQNTSSLKRTSEQQEIVKKTKPEKKSLKRL
jgi:ubiquitin-conjugating enzyme E2 S